MTESKDDSELNERECKRARIGNSSPDRAPEHNKVGELSQSEPTSCTTSTLSVNSECNSVIDNSCEASEVSCDKKDDESAADMHACAICMRNETDGKIELLPHRCSQCREDAWKVCAECEAALLSRECPLCRASYAPQVFYAFRDDDALGSNKIFMKIYLISLDSVLVYDRSSSMMYFSLPKDNSLPQKEIEYVTCRLPMDASRVEDGQFLFTNEVWNELQELGDQLEVVDIRSTLRNLTQILSSPNTQLFSRYQMSGILDMIEIQND